MVFVSFVVDVWATASSRNHEEHEGPADSIGSDNSRVRIPSTVLVVRILLSDVPPLLQRAVSRLPLPDLDHPGPNC